MLSKLVIILLITIVLSIKQGPPPSNDDQDLHANFQEGQVKLETGILSVFHDGSWGAVCDDAFDLNYLAADVVCKQINGFDFWATSMIGGQQCVDPSFWLDDVYCQGWESRLVECAHLPYGEHNCSSEVECIYIECGHFQQNTAGSGTDGEYAPSYNTEQNWQPWDGFLTLNGGLVEIFTQGQWSQVCASENVTWETADISCRQVFGNTYWASGYSVSDQCPNQQFIHDVQCDGFEQFVIDCPHTVDQSCDTGCFYISCYENVPPPQYDFYSYPYLEVNWNVPEEQIDWYTGIVSIVHNGEVRGLCDDFVDQSTLSGDVLCRQIYGQGFISSQLVGGQQCPHEDFWLDDLQCEGWEANIDDCYHLPWGQHNCSIQSECLLLSCVPQPLPHQDEETWYTQQWQQDPQQWQQNDGFEGQLSLGNGVLQIFHDNQWGLVCDDYFDFRAADVACGQIYGPNYKAYDFLTSQYCGESPQFLLDNVACYGNELQLQDCQHNVFGDHDCWQNECVNVQCYYEEPNVQWNEGQLNIDGNGILTIYHSGEWGNICDDGFTWNYNNLFVACQQALGWDYYPVDWVEGQQCPYQQFWLDQVHCYGYEQSLADCEHQSWGQHDCSWQSECIYLQCAQQLY